MDGPSSEAGDALTAVVIRQFTPSRIERQLLAQVFELVCGPQCEAEASHATALSRSPTHGVRTGERAIEAPSAGRHAA